MHVCMGWVEVGGGVGSRDGALQQHEEGGTHNAALVFTAISTANSKKESRAPKPCVIGRRVSATITRGQVEVIQRGSPAQFVAQRSGVDICWCNFEACSGPERYVQYI